MNWACSIFQYKVTFPRKLNDENPTILPEGETGNHLHRQTFVRPCSGTQSEKSEMKENNRGQQTVRGKSHMVN